MPFFTWGNSFGFDDDLQRHRTPGYGQSLPRARGWTPSQWPAYLAGIKRVAGRLGSDERPSEEKATARIVYCNQKDMHLRVHAGVVGMRGKHNYKLTFNPAWRPGSRQSVLALHVALT